MIVLGKHTEPYNGTTKSLSNITYVRWRLIVKIYLVFFEGLLILQSLLEKGGFLGLFQFIEGSENDGVETFEGKAQYVQR